MIETIGIALTGLDSAAKKLGASASNIANLQTVGSLEGGGQAPYTPQTTQSVTADNGGVNTRVVDRQNAFVPSYNPDSPFADGNGIIGVPNIDLAEEAVNLTISKVEFAANLKVIEAASELADELLNAFDQEA